jgi:hypothetical protein
MVDEGAADHEEWMRAADILYRRHLARSETTSLRDPADIPHMQMLGTAFTRRRVAIVYRRPTELCHYTRTANLEPILASGFLRATNAEQCNDAREVIHARERIDECVYTHIVTSMPRSPSNRFFHYIREAVTSVKATYYVTCFSSRDNGRIEWGDYGDRGKGIVLVFDADELTDPRGPIEREVVTLRPIIYEPRDQREQLLTACILAIGTINRRYGLTWDFSSPDPFVLMVAASLCSHLAHQATAFKDEFWIDEREWRLVMPLYGSPEDAAVIHTSPDGRQYTAIRPRRGKRLPIARVVVGPVAPEGTESAVEATLRAHGYDVPVTRSDVPLR